MKKLYPLLSVLFLIYWGCEDKDTTPTEVTLWGEVYLTKTFNMFHTHIHIVKLFLSLELY